VNLTCDRSRCRACCCCPGRQVAGVQSRSPAGSVTVAPAIARSWRQCVAPAPGLVVVGRSVRRPRLARNQACTVKVASTSAWPVNDGLEASGGSEQIHCWRLERGRAGTVECNPCCSAGQVIVRSWCRSAYR